MIFNENGLAVLMRGGLSYGGSGDGTVRIKPWTHIITDPDYENQPAIDLYRAHCTGNIVIFCDPRKRPPIEGQKKPDEVLFWLKPRSTKWTTKRFCCYVEEILVYRGKKSTFNQLHWSSLSGIFTDGFVDKPDHPYAKPLSMIEVLILAYTAPGDLVFDPFCGSGTVGVACFKHGREYVGCELDEKYFEMAERRLESLR